MDNTHPARLNDTEVPVLAAIGSGNRLHAFRPAPPGLHRETSGARAAHMHNVDPSLIRSPRLVRRVKVALLNTCHRKPPSVEVPPTISSRPPTRTAKAGGVHSLPGAGTKVPPTEKIPLGTA